MFFPTNFYNSAETVTNNSALILAEVQNILRELGFAANISAKLATIFVGSNTSAKALVRAYQTKRLRTRIFFLISCLLGANGAIEATTTLPYVCCRVPVNALLADVLALSFYNAAIQTMDKREYEEIIHTPKPTNIPTVRGGQLKNERLFKILAIFLIFAPMKNNKGRMDMNQLTSIVNIANTNQDKISMSDLNMLKKDIIDLSESHLSESSSLKLRKRAKSVHGYSKFSEWSKTLESVNQIDSSYLTETRVQIDPLE